MQNRIRSRWLPLGTSQSGQHDMSGRKRLRSGSCPLARMDHPPRVGGGSATDLDSANTVEPGGGRRSTGHRVAVTEPGFCSESIESAAQFLSIRSPGRGRWPRGTPGRVTPSAGRNADRGSGDDVVADMFDVPDAGTAKPGTSGPTPSSGGTTGRLAQDPAIGPRSHRSQVFGLDHFLRHLAL